MSGEAGALDRRNSDDKRMAPRKKKRGHRPKWPVPSGLSDRLPPTQQQVLCCWQGQNLRRGCLRSTADKPG